MSSDNFRSHGIFEAVENVILQAIGFCDNTYIQYFGKYVCAVNLDLYQNFHTLGI